MRLQVLGEGEDDRDIQLCCNIGRPDGKWVVHAIDTVINNACADVNSVNVLAVRSLQHRQLLH